MSAGIGHNPLSRPPLFLLHSQAFTKRDKWKDETGGRPGNKATLLVQYEPVTLCYTVLHCASCICCTVTLITFIHSLGGCITLCYAAWAHGGKVPPSPPTCVSITVPWRLPGGEQKISPSLPSASFPGLTQLWTGNEATLPQYHTNAYKVPWPFWAVSLAPVWFIIAWV